MAAAQDGLAVATLDLDRQRTLTKWWSQRPEEGVVQFDHHEGRLEQLDAALADLADYDLIVVDTPPGVEDHPEAVKRLVGIAAMVLVPTSPTKDDRESVIPWMNLLKAYGKPAAFILNKAKRKTRVLDAARAQLNRAGALCPIAIHDFEDIHTAFESGLTVLDLTRASGADEVAGIWHFVKNQLAVRLGDLTR